MAERPDKAYFDNEVIDQRDKSARGWIIGEGHVSVEEARQRALIELTAAESKLAERQADLMTANAALDQAKRGRDKAYNARQEARHDVKMKQRHLAYVCSTDAPEEP